MDLTHVHYSRKNQKLTHVFFVNFETPQLIQSSAIFNEVLSTNNIFSENSANKEYVHNTSDTKACLEIDLKKDHPTLIFQSAYIEPNREVIIYVKDVKDPIILKHDDIKGVVTRGNISVSSIKIRNCTVTLKNSCEPQIKYIEPDVLKHNSRVDNSFYKEKTGITDVDCLIIQS